MPTRRRREEKTHVVLQRIHSLKDRLRTSQAVSGELEKLRAESERLRKERDDLRAELAEVGEELEGARAEASKREKEWAEADRTAQAFLKEVREKEREIRDCLARQREMQDATALVNRLEGELEEAEAEKKRLSATLATLREEVKEARSDKKALRSEVDSQIEEVEAEKERLSRALENLRREMEEVQRDNAALARDLRTAREAPRRRVPAGESNGGGSVEESGLKKELAHLREERVRVAGILKRLMSAVGTARSERDEARRALEEARSVVSGEETTEPPAAPAAAVTEPGTDRIVRETPRAEPARAEPVTGTGERDIAVQEEKLRELLDGLKGGGNPVRARTEALGGRQRAGVFAQTEEISPPVGNPPNPSDPVREGTATGDPLAFLFDSEEAPEKIELETVRQLVRSYLAFLKRSPGEALRFSYGGNPGEYLRQHSHNVAKLAMFLAMNLGDRDEDVLMLGLSGLLHDIGLVEVPESILNKPGPLDDSEMRWIQMHPTMGGRVLETVEGLEKEIPQVVRQHHERIDGSGYPEGLRGDALHRFAKILSLVDGYEAMSAPRVYREELLPNESMRVIARPLILAQQLDLPGGFSADDMTHPSPSRAMEEVVLQTPQIYDPTLVRAFLIAMSYYPIGSYVRLSSGEVARVVGTNSEEVRKPIVKVILDPEGRIPKDQILVDLLSEQAKRVSHAVSGVPYEDLP